MVVAPIGTGPPVGLNASRLLRGGFKGKGAVGGMSPFPVADSPETTPPAWAQPVFGCAKGLL